MRYDTDSWCVVIFPAETKCVVIDCCCDKSCPKSRYEFWKVKILFC